MEYQENTNRPEISMYEDGSDLSHGPGTSFKTSFLGFDKEDVISYIDGLVRDVSEQKDHLETSLNRLTEQNRDLIERVNRYEQRIHMVQQELDDEKLYNQNAHEREELFKKAISALQEKVAFLQNNTVSPTGGIDAAYEEQTQRANEIVLRLREEILRKDENISRLSEELSRRNDIILNQDKILASKDQQVLDQTKSLEEQKQQLLTRTDELHRLMEQTASLKSRIELLEQKRNEVIAELDDTRAKLQAALLQKQKDSEEMERLRQQQQEDRGALERLREQQMAERSELERYREQQMAERNEIERVRAQQQAAHEELEKARQQQQAEQESMERVRRQQQQEGQRLMQMQQTIRRQAELVEQAKSKLASESASLERTKEQLKSQTDMLEQRIQKQQELERKAKRKEEEERTRRQDIYRPAESAVSYDPTRGYGARQTPSYSFEGETQYGGSATYDSMNRTDYTPTYRQQPSAESSSYMSGVSGYEQPPVRAAEKKDLKYSYPDAAYGYPAENYKKDVRAYAPGEVRREQTPAQPYRSNEPVSYYQTPPASGSGLYDPYTDTRSPQRNQQQEFPSRENRENSDIPRYRSDFKQY